MFDAAGQPAGDEGLPMLQPSSCMLLLYYYRCLDPIRGDFRDASCRPDPDFETLTLGICRPRLRQHIAQRPDRDSLRIMFYTREPRTEELVLTALLGIERSFATHDEALAELGVKGRPNLLVDENPCRRGTTYVRGRRSLVPRSAGCNCRGYLRDPQKQDRAVFPYIVFRRDTARLNLDDPARLPFARLQRFCPAFFRTHPERRMWSTFQQATQGACHEFSSTLELEALVGCFRDASGCLQTRHASPSCVRTGGGCVSGRCS